MASYEGEMEHSGSDKPVGSSSVEEKQKDHLFQDKATISSHMGVKNK